MLRRRAASASRPSPSSAAAAGSGTIVKVDTGDGWLAVVRPKKSSETRFRAPVQLDDSREVCDQCRGGDLELVDGARDTSGIDVLIEDRGESIASREEAGEVPGVAPPARVLRLARRDRRGERGRVLEPTVDEIVLPALRIAGHREQHRLADEVRELVRVHRERDGTRRGRKRDQP